VSYDSQDILRAFAEKHGIEFPLLSDQGSHEMRRLGLLNERIREDHAVYGIEPNPRHEGLPYPGVFVLDEAGIITNKRFHESYRERDTGAALIASTLGLREPADGAAWTTVDDVVRARAWLDSPTYCFFQRIHLNVEVAVAPGLHVYGSPASEGLVPLTVELAQLDGIEIGAAAWPAPHPFRPAGLAFELPVHDGLVRGSLPLTFSGAPGAGDRLVRVTIRYQACSESSCFPPTSAQLELLVREVALVDRTLPTSAAKI
jgi:cytochrome c biogenesis DsbD-like protein/AhpC/TSA family protein